MTKEEYVKTAEPNDITVCEECGSLFIKSAMRGLCAECASILYGYTACGHTFRDGRCIKCGYDGSTNKYLQSLKHKGG